MSDVCNVCILVFVAICDMCLVNQQGSVLSILIDVTFSKAILKKADILVSAFNERILRAAVHRFITIQFLAPYPWSIFAFCERNLSSNSPRSEVLLES